MKQNLMNRDIDMAGSGTGSKNRIKGKTNQLAVDLTRLLFWNVDFDRESLATIKEYSKKGTIVYTSFESTQTSLQIFLFLLKKHKLPMPAMEIGFSLYRLQAFSELAGRMTRFFKNLFNRAGRDGGSDFTLIKRTLEQSPIVISILSQKLFFQRYVDIQSDIFQKLIEIQKTQERPIYIVPKIMFWNMNPERTRTLMASRATGDRGILSGLFTRIKCRTPSFIRLSTPINLREEIKRSPSGDTKFIVQGLRSRLLEIYSHEKRAILGPVLKSGQEMMEKVLYSKNVTTAIDELVTEEKAQERKLRVKAYKYYREIAADFSIIYIKYFERVINFIFRRIFDGIDYDINQLKKIREAARHGPLVIVPSHRSHMDYLIVSSIFYLNKIIPPHILAGSNLMFFPMGKIFRRSGAFFMRRSFKGLKLYSVIFRQYVKTLVNEGYSIEFFIEGGRTRSGKILSPKLGMLKYLLEAVEEGYNKNLVFVPISINYNRILEESSYHSELKGNEKVTESTGSFVRSGSLLRREYGRVHVEIGDPFTYHDLKRIFRHEKDLTVPAGDFITRRISEIVLVTPVALLTSAMLFSSGRGFNREMLKKNLVILHEYLMFMKVKQSIVLDDEGNYDEIIDYVADNFKHDHILKVTAKVEYDDDSGPATEEFYVINRDSRGRITFYKNNIVHFFIPIAFLAVSVINSADKNRVSLKRVREEFAVLREFFSSEFIYPDSMDDDEKLIGLLSEYLEGRGILARRGGMITIHDEGREELRFFADILQDFFESYLVVYNTLLEPRRKKRGRKEFLHDVRRNGVAMLHSGEIRLVESLSVSNYNNAIRHLISSGAASVEEGEEGLIKVVDASKAQKARKKIIDYMKRVS